MANRVAEVNKALKALGKAEKLTRGEGYYYWRDGEAASWRATAVYVYRASDLSVREWLEEYHYHAGAN
jgi:hypothetical protein